MANAETRSKRVSFIGIAAPWCCKAKHSPSALPSHLITDTHRTQLLASRRHADRRRGFHQGSAPSDRHNRNARTIAAAPSVPDNRSDVIRRQLALKFIAGNAPIGEQKQQRDQASHPFAKPAQTAWDDQTKKRPAQPSGAAGDSKGWRSTWRTAQHATSGGGKKSIGQKASPDSQSSRHRSVGSALASARQPRYRDVTWCLISAVPWSWRDNGQRRADRGAVLPHDNPDPDSQQRRACRCFWDGKGLNAPSAWPESLAAPKIAPWVRVLSFDLRPLETSTWTRLGLSRCSIPNRARATTRCRQAGPDIVIDHHPPRPISAEVPWCDIRPEFGASCTIVWRYLKQAGIELSADLATAFLYGIKTETRDLGRECGPHERTAYLELSAQANHTSCIRLPIPNKPRRAFCRDGPRVPSSHLLGRALAVNQRTVQYPISSLRLQSLCWRSEKAANTGGVWANTEGQVFCRFAAKTKTRMPVNLIRRVVPVKTSAAGVTPA